MHVAERPKHVDASIEPSRRTQPDAPSARRAISESDDDALVARRSPAVPDPYLFDEPTARGPAVRTEELQRAAPVRPAPPRVPVVAVGGAPSSVGRMRVSQKTLVGGLDVAVARAVLREHAGGSAPDFDVTEAVATEVTEMSALGMPGSAIVTPAASPSQVDIPVTEGLERESSLVDIPTAQQISPAAFVSSEASPHELSRAELSRAELSPTDVATPAAAPLAPRPRSSSASWSSVRMPTAAFGRRTSRVGLWIGAGALAVAAVAGVLFVREGFSTDVPTRGEPAEATSDRIARDATIRGRAARPARGGSTPAATPAAHKPARPQKRR